ncbi:N-alpha-acetyltransferase 80 [Saguinus oedipus]|uniref:N-alpha-acetyltransferase 80 n=1 Tax=Saguinus oedipus TaxID=9490 RepID=A0ABQ9U3E0_SAGOE|nr:N-alpha-acetyltransferase 80 [Saguinus oedipus]
MELILSASPAELTLDPTCQPELTLKSSLTKLNLDPTCQRELPLDSTCQPKMTFSPSAAELTLDLEHQPEETLAPSLAELTLEPSSDAFPLCLMLLSPNPTPKAAPIVVGHARLSRVLNQPQSLLVETVVVARALRGRGFGRRLMEGLEVFARARGFRKLHLTTHDQLHFYTHLGYQVGEPVQGLVFTSRQLPATLLNFFPTALSPQLPWKAPNLTVQAAPRGSKGPPLPPPPPLPECLTTSPPAPSGPPPKSLLETQYQNMRGCPIFWMEKDI